MFSYRYLVSAEFGTRGASSRHKNVLQFCPRAYLNTGRAIFDFESVVNLALVRHNLFFPNEMKLY